MISGATESSYGFLKKYFVPPAGVIIDHNPRQLITSSNAVKILWAHHGHDQPIYLGTNWNKITHVVCVSNWQKEQFVKMLKVPAQKITVIRNGAADYFKPAQKQKVLIYASAPYRGLSCLPDIFERVIKHHPDAKLKVFSSMNLHGLTESKETTQIYQRLKELPNVEYSPVIPHQKLAEHFSTAAVFAYPNIWEETFCVALAEAMRAGCIPVLSNIGALPETALGSAHLVTMQGISTTYGWQVSSEFCQEFADKLVQVLDTYKYVDINHLSATAAYYYSWELISREWKLLVDRLIKENKKMEQSNVTSLVNYCGAEIASDASILQKVKDEIFKWEEYDKEHAQGRSNFQIEKFIALDNFTIASSFSAILKNRRIMAEGLFAKITEMKEKQREFEYKWKEEDQSKPLQWFNERSDRKLCWYDLDQANLENYLRSSELEIRDRIQQIEFFDKILTRLLEMNGGPITREQFEKEDHIYWERRFANQAFDEMVSRQTGISIGNLHSMRRATAPTLVSDDVNRVKNGYPDLAKAVDGNQSEFLLGLQEKIAAGLEEVTGQPMGLHRKTIANKLDRIDQIGLADDQHPSPMKLFNSLYTKK